MKKTFARIVVMVLAFAIGYGFAVLVIGRALDAPPTNSVTTEFNKQCIAAGGLAIPTANGAAVCLTDFQIESVEP